jgi:hypothetical protein
MSIGMKICFCALLCLSAINAQKFLVERPSGYEAKIKAEAIRNDLQKAMASAMGQGHGVHGERLMEVREFLSRIFMTLPKNSYGRIEQPMLRYALHRYFAKRYAIAVRGMEPTLNHSHFSKGRESMGADVLLDQVPAYTESLLEGRFADHGFGLDDVVVMAATLEQLVLGSGSAGLSTAYRLRNQSTSGTLNREEFDAVLETYALLWLVGDGADLDATQVTTDRSFIEEALPSWNEVADFSHGEVDRAIHERRTPKVGILFRRSTPSQTAKAS